MFENALRLASILMRVFAVCGCVFSGSALAKTPPCVPGGVCCISATCGTLEQFKRNAEVICLQADAVENKSLAQGIELSGRCAAAKIAASRVEETQQENAKEHQRALDARRKAVEMGAAPLPTGQEALAAALKITTQAADDCRAKRLRGELPSHAASVQCANPPMLRAFNEAHYRYMDLIQFFAARRLELATKIDRGKMTERQGEVEMQKVFASIQATERQRDAAAR